MYECQLPSGQTDYIQLGWLVALVLDSSGDYHEKEWLSLKKEIREDAFISSLILNGEYKSEELSKSTLVQDETTLKNVLLHTSL